MRPGLDQSEAARDRLAAFDEGLRSRRIQHDDSGLQRQRRHEAEIISDPQSLDRNVVLAADRGIDRDEIVLAGQLHTVARQIDHGDGAGARGLGLLHEVAKTLAQRVAIEVARADDVKARRLQGLRDQAGVIGCGRQWRLGVGAVADDKRDALFLLLGGGRHRQYPKRGSGTAGKRRGS